MVPKVHPRFLRDRRTAHEETHEKKRALVLGGRRGAGLPLPKEIARLLPHPCVPRLRTPFRPPNGRQYIRVGDRPNTTLRGRREGHRVRQPDAQWG